MDSIRNPLEWGRDQIKHAAFALGTTARALGGTSDARSVSTPQVRSIGLADLKDVLARGLADFGAWRTDVIFLCVIYPVIGIVLARAAFGADMLPLLFPLASGFALVGPLAAVGLYEMSRRREQGDHITWADAFGVVGAPSFGAIVLLGLILCGIFGAWIVAAQMIYDMTLGPQPPASVESFLRDVFTTAAGWTMVGVGIFVGFLFAVAAFAISVVSFPLLLDRGVNLGTAIVTSVRAVVRNPVPMAVWGLVVAAGLVAGTLPLFVGLIIVIPVLGHATWHLYRKLVAPPA